jgi:DNA-binding NtrC family response regulator
MKKILYVDDKFTFYTMHVEELKKNGSPVFKENKLEQLISVINEQNPDEVVMDIRAANYRGLDMIKKASELCHHIPFSLCTGAFRHVLKSILSCEKPETWYSKQKTA